ncbi:hypothetical protein PsYK624_098070 [Phanerochaete sordida]|uniref:Uncharacterized protein n=1 Tax=Phanerochaete sordida TaxID=48140 RepID=A0A9P3GF38_9APHY|nr:hypothetical protein PsYK624_098070 [Phanerochaete sordida]
MHYKTAYDSLPHFDDDARSDIRKGEAEHENEPPPPSGRRSALVEIALVVTCVLAHVALVALFVALLAIQKLRDGRLINFDRNELGSVTGFVYAQLTNKPSWIIKAYTVPLLFITQKLALRRVVRADHTLTAMDDQASAWLGLGATVPVVWRYKDMLGKGARGTRKADLRTLAFIVCIVLYLGAGLVLGMVATDLFVFANTWGATGYQNLASHMLMDEISADNTSMLESSPVISVLPLLNSSSNVAMTTTGLWNNVVYSVPNYFSTLSIPAHALVFQADCKVLPYVQQDLTLVREKIPRYVFTTADSSLREVDFSAAMISRTLNVRPAQQRNGTLLPTILIASTLPVVAENGQAAPWTPIDPPQVPNKCRVVSSCDTIAQVQIFACNLNGLASQVQLDTKVLPYSVDLSVPSPDPSSWEEWSGPDNASSLPQMPTLAFQFSSSSGVSQYTLTMNMGRETEYYHYTLLEETLMEVLGYYNLSMPAVSLQDLNFMLSRAFALVYWRTAINTMALSAEESPELGSGYSPWQARDLVFVNPSSSWYGLALSTVMLATAGVLIWQPKTRPKKGEHYRLEGLGVLQMTWLLGRDAAGVAVDLARDPEPTLKNLRKRGKELKNPYPYI